jgi:hypothetical protein
LVEHCSKNACAADFQVAAANQHKRIRAMFGTETGYLRSNVADGHEDVDGEVGQPTAERGPEVIDDPTCPGRPFVLWLIDVSWGANASRFGRHRRMRRDDIQQIEGCAETASQLNDRPQRASRGRGTI